jgi:hypothetical protein
MRAFFWETPPFSSKTAGGVPFEFVALEAPILDDAEEDGSAFAEHPSPPPAPSAAGGGSVQFRVFENLGRDALLLAPPDRAANTSTIPRNALVHMAAFMRDAPVDVKLELFAEMGRTLHTELFQREQERRLQLDEEAPVWVSTEGSGVPFLHVRLDTSPKYIHYDAYRRFSSVMK